MNEAFPNIGRCISILDRLMKMYYDHGLSGFELGWGQQFYAEYIYDHPGASAQEMVEYIRVDKGTLTKSIRKLEEIGYVRVESDPKDRRIKRLFLTQKGQPAVRRIKEIHRSFYEALCAGLPPQEVQACERTLEQMVEHLNQRVWHRMEESHGA